MNCEKCGTEMLIFIEGSCQGVRCPNCGWAIVTTQIDKIRADRTLYTITILQTPNSKTSQIRLIAKLANVNFLKAKEMLSLDKVHLCQEKAPVIKIIMDNLENENIPFTLTPEFKS